MTLNRHFALNSVLCRYVWSSEAWLRSLATLKLVMNVVGARKPRDAAAVLFGLKFADDIHYNLRVAIQASKPGFRAVAVLRTLGPGEHRPPNLAQTSPHKFLDTVVLLLIELIGSMVNFA